jgi:hypothetical protein
MTARQNIFSLTAFGLLALALLVIWQDSHNGPDDYRLANYGFQRAIGGVGLGAVMVPAWNFRDYDPRLQQVADDSIYPLPGGYSYTPERLVMVTSFATGK